MKISEITLNELKTYCGIFEDDEDTNNQISNIYMPAAKAYIKGYTSLSDDEIESHEDLAIAFCAIVCEMYDVRSATASTYSHRSETISTILNMYSDNQIA